MSLVSLMVGMLMLMGSAGALMVSYRSVVQNGVAASANAKRSTEVASGLLAAMFELRQAGFGQGASNAKPGGAVNVNLVLLNGAAMSGASLAGAAQAVGTTVVSGNALVWDTGINGSVQCSALVGTAAGALLRLGPVPCAQASAWGSLNWGSPTQIITIGAGAVSMQVQKTSCWPYGLAPAASASIPSLVQVTVVGTGTGAASACLASLPN
ncbi:MAG: hypothetical protein V4795_08155 [Pseudomonadota bacterium]